MPRRALTLVASNGRLLDHGEHDIPITLVALDDPDFFDELDREVDFETAALASEAFAALFINMRDCLRRGEPVRAYAVEELRVALEEFTADLERKSLAQ